MEESKYFNTKNSINIINNNPQINNQAINISNKNIDNKYEIPIKEVDIINKQNAEEGDDNLNISFLLPKNLFENLDKEQEVDKFENEIHLSNSNIDNNNYNFPKLNLQTDNNSNQKNNHLNENINSDLNPLEIGKNYHPEIQNYLPINKNIDITNENNQVRPINVYNNNNNYNIIYSPNINYINNNVQNPNFFPPNLSEINRDIMLNDPQLFNMNNYSNSIFNNIQNIDLSLNNNKILPKRKVIDDYSLVMFGRKGWICIYCSNFNYDSRKKCNRCQIIKTPKRVEDYLNEEKNKNDTNKKNLWYCIYCGNYNYAFRIICNRCRMKKNM